MIIVNHTASVNPHPQLTPDQLTRIHDKTLSRMIEMHHAGDVPVARLRLGGIPPLDTLESEQRRREHAHREAA